MLANNNIFSSGIIVTNIQRASFHDGPGVRTTVFMKGCALRCPWCCNPENISFDIQKYMKDGYEKTYGMLMTTEELYKEIMKDRPFYTGEIGDYSISDKKLLEKLPGGVTFSGGEPLIHIKNLEPLLCRLKTEHIHITFETSLYVNMDNLKTALKYADLMYIDIKSMDETFCQTILKGNLQQFNNNFRCVLTSKQPIVIRIPVIGGYTDNLKARKSVISFLKDNINENILKVELLKEHNLGISKYISLGYDIPIYKGVSDIIMESYRNEMISAGINAEICSI